MKHGNLSDSKFKNWLQHRVIFINDNKVVYQGEEKSINDMKIVYNSISHSKQRKK